MGWAWEGAARTRSVTGCRQIEGARDLFAERVPLGPVGEVTVPEEVTDLLERRVLCQILDAVA
jgi:hypothetical protein